MKAQARGTEGRDFKPYSLNRKHVALPRNPLSARFRADLPKSTLDVR
jgi:hypothetical protein